ncbi:hypothetical protein ACNKHO_25970 [Shigella flexneri]
MLRRCWNRPADLIDFDEAWYGDARFNPVYQLITMRCAGNSWRPLLAYRFRHHSTHKLLNALSQALIFMSARRGAVNSALQSG